MRGEHLVVDVVVKQGHHHKGQGTTHWQPLMPVFAQSHQQHEQELGNDESRYKPSGMAGDDVQ